MGVQKEWCPNISYSVVFPEEMNIFSFFLEILLLIWNYK